MTTPIWSDPEFRTWCDREFDAITQFARASKVPTGFGYLDANGVVDPSRPVELWITCRMTHVFALAALRGQEGAPALVDHGLRALTQYFHDSEYGGWYSAIEHEPGANGRGVLVGDGRKEAYAHAFVILAACSALAAQRPGARDLLDAALACEEEHWLEPDIGRVRESWDRAFASTEEYRGINANMHTTEAFLAAWDATGQRTWLDRAVGILRFAHDRAAEAQWRLPEHYSSKWDVLADYNRDRPADAFRPFGITPGHGLEWSRLMLQARAALVAANDTPEPWMATGAVHLFARAVADGWNVDGARGFVYTTDFAGEPIVRERMHWVLCEAVGAGIVLGRILDGVSARGASLAQLVLAVAAPEAPSASPDSATPREISELVAQWVDYARTYLREAPGRWWHELTPDNRPGTRTWPGKPDAYHVAQMLLVAQTPAHLSFAAALARQDQTR